MKNFYLTAKALTCAVFVSVPLLFCEEALSQDVSDCMDGFAQMQKNVSNSDLSFTAVTGLNTNLYSFTYIHNRVNGESYSLWRSLNGEVAGYALKGLRGYDFNSDRNYKGPLTWRHTQIFDRLFNVETKLSGYTCILTGRTRISGHRATLLRLAPLDDLRYNYVIAADDITMLPLELNVVSPDGFVVMKVNATNLQTGDEVEKFSFDEEALTQFSKSESLNGEAKSAASDIPSKYCTYDSILLETNNHNSAAAAPGSAAAWSELNIPAQFKLLSRGSIKQTDNTFVPFQLFSDGIVTFRVYKNKKSTLIMPAVTNGTLTILRREFGPYEYALVGEVPPQLAESVLARLGASSN